VSDELRSLYYRAEGLLKRLGMRFRLGTQKGAI
jgi:hypothetical protein